MDSLNAAKQLRDSKKLFFFGLILICCGSYFAFFYHLDQRPLHVYDESLNLLHAWEMAESGNLIVRTHNRLPDFWETKPPMLTWLQAGCIKIIGPSVLAGRLPSALAAFGTCLLIFLFLAKRFHNPVWGICAAFILMTSPGFTDRHIARTGDHDALYTFFLTLQLFLIWEWFHTRKSKILIYSALGFLFAYLTKSSASLFFLPGIFLWLVAEKKLKILLKQPTLYLGLAIFSIVIISFYFFHEKLTPGYMNAVWNQEWLPYFTRNTDPKSGNVFSFVIGFFDGRFQPWLYAFPLFLLLFPFFKSRIEFSFFKLIFFSGLGYLIVISLGSSNLWYDAALFPILSMLTGFAIGTLILWTLERLITKIPKGSVIILLLIFISFFGFPFQLLVRKNQNDRDLFPGERFPYLHASISKISEKESEITIIENEFNPALEFYIRKWNLEGSKYRMTQSDTSIQSGLCLVCHEGKFFTTYSGLIDTLINEKKCQLMRIRP